MSTPIAVVDAHDRFVRWSTRAEVHGQRLHHRSAAVLVFHPEPTEAGEERMLLQQRRHDKQTWPGYWDVAVAGHVEKESYPAGWDERLDEVYRDTARRELEEELGVSVPAEALEQLVHLPPDARHYDQCRLFAVTHAGPFTLQEDEVEDARWVTPTAYDAMVASGAKITEILVDEIAWLRARGRFVR